MRTFKNIGIVITVCIVVLTYNSYERVSFGKLEKENKFLHESIDSLMVDSLECLGEVEKSKTMYKELLKGLVDTGKSMCGEYFVKAQDIYNTEDDCNEKN